MMRGLMMMVGAGLIAAAVPAQAQVAPGDPADDAAYPYAEEDARWAAGQAEPEGTEPEEVVIVEEHRYRPGDTYRGDGQGYVSEGEVRARSRQRCSGTTGAILGGLAGALLGGDIGGGYRGRGWRREYRRSGTGALVGAGVGAIIGSEIDRNACAERRVHRR